MIDVFVISLEAPRRADLIHSLESVEDLRTYVVPGVDGATLPDVVCLALTGNEGWTRNKGSIGCFLGHVAAWERIASSENRLSIVLEEDARVGDISRLRDAPIPDDADIVFINERLSPSPCGDGQVQIVPFSMMLAELDRTRRGPGGDGYLLTPAGARKLVTACRKDLYYGHVDGRLMRYASSSDDLSRLTDDSEIKYIILNHHNPCLIPELGILKSYSSIPAFVWHANKDSIRESIDARARLPKG